jgi:CBS domain-containing protein
MTKVADLLRNKGTDVWSVSINDTVLDAIKMMDAKGVSALTVMQGTALAGIISERDYARKVILKGRSSQETLVKEIMTSNVFYASPDQECSSCLAIMNKHKVRHLPVLNEEKVVGMLSIGDLVKNIIDEQRYTIEHLEHVISWSESY